MRSALLVLATIVLLAPSPAAGASLGRELSRELSRAGTSSGGMVVDLDSGRQLWAVRPGAPRIPASVEKLWTTSTALARVGPDARLTTEVLVRGKDLYLRGSGDFTFGIAELSRLAQAVRRQGTRNVRGRVFGDETRFDARRGIPSSDFGFSPDVEPLSALPYARNLFAGRYVASPALRAAEDLTRALRKLGVRVRGDAAVGRTPASALRIAQDLSPPVSDLVRLINVPSDNFGAETLLKVVGAEVRGAGTTAAGAAVVRAQAAAIGGRPRIRDGSGLDRGNRSSPRDVVGLLREMSRDDSFRASLAVAGRSGTLHDRMRRTPAAGRCTAKTGTLSDVSALAGYCPTRNGHTLAFAFLMNGVHPTSARALQDRMAVALASHRG